MARLALPSGWFVALTRRHGPLRMYQWLWLAICVVAALAIAAPRILSQPVFYQSVAAVQLDAAARYRELYHDGKPDEDFQAVEFQTLALLKARHPDLGGPTFGVRFVPQEAGKVVVEALGRTPQEARTLADEAAATLVSQIRAAGGREIMRNLLGWEQVVALDGQPPESPFQGILRRLILTSAFNLNRAVEPVSRHLTVDELPPEELNDLTRAIEVREEQIALIDLPQAERNHAEALAAGESSRAEQSERDIRRLIEGRQALRSALNVLYSDHGTVFHADTPSDAYRSERSVLPNAPVDRRIPLLLAMTLLGGLVFGGVSVAVDSSAGALRKVNELWNYRALIRNLVLRDLRVRYKSSVLGYLWTQIAPLLTMLVFWFVFMPVTIGAFRPLEQARSLR